MQLIKLFMTKDEDLYDKTLNDVFDDEFYASNFWLYWQTMFAFEKWHSALEMKLYVQRFIHHIGGLPDFLGAQVHALQPVRIADFADGEVSGSARRGFSV